MKRYALPIALAATLFSQGAYGQTPPTSATPIVGYYNFDVQEGNSAWVSGFVAKKDFQGAATSITSGSPNSTINQTGATWTPGAFNLHYVEILSGPMTGLILDVVDNAAATVTVQGDLTALGVTGTPTYAIRRHATFGTLFAGGAGLVAFEDSIALENSDASQTVAYFDGTNWVDSLTSLNADDTIVYPGQGIMITALADRTVTFGGNEIAYVKTGPTMVPVYVAANNFVGVVNPLVNPTTPTAIDSTTLGAYGLAAPSGLEAFADSAATFTIDGIFNTVNVYYSDGTNVINSLTSANADADTVLNGVAIQILPLDDGLITLPQTFTSN
jgi:hypothetical protein